MRNIQVLKPFYRKEEILKEVAKCLDTSWTGNGFLTDEFEEKWKKYTGFKNAALLNSATSALHLAFYQLKKKYKWKDNDEIITSPLTFVSTNHAILHNKLKPIFTDVDEYGCLDVKSVKSKITDKTKAILFVGLGGNTGNLNYLRDVAQENKIPIILDAAHMSGTRFKHNFEHVGIQKEIIATIFSYQSVKNLSSFDSGMLCWSDSNNDFSSSEMEKETKSLAWLGITDSTFSRTNSKGAYKYYYDVLDCGWKYHSNSIAASFLNVGLKYLDQDNAYRRFLADQYVYHLNGKIKIVPTHDDCLSSRHLFQILVDKRDEVMMALNQYGIYPGVHYRTNTVYSMYSDAEGTCPKADEFSDKTISLPLHMHLTANDVEYVCDKLLEVIK